MLSEAIPSASSYSKLVRKLSQSHALEDMQEQLLKQAMAESFITDDTIAIDATHIEARDQAPAKQEKKKTELKKHGRKSKVEREAWLEQKDEEEKQKPIFKKEIAAQLSETFHVLRDEMPLDPQWEIKKNSDGKMSSGMAIKATLPLSLITVGGNLNFTGLTNTSLLPE